MLKVQITQNFLMPSFQTVNKNQQETQLILMDPQTASLYLLHQYYCTSSQDYGDLIALLQTQASQGTQSPYILNPVVYLPIKYTNQEFQTSHFVQVLYQYGSHTLEQELYLRIREKNYFEEHEIWSILGSCVLGLKNLKDKQFTHSSICSNDIFVAKDGQIKLCHPMVRTYDHANSQQVQQQYFQRAIGENYYFAPQQLPFSQHSKQQIQITLQTIFKSDIFSTGMTIISLCLLQPITDCYLKHSTRHSYQIYISSERLGQYFNALEQIYSPDLVGMLFGMVAYNPEERMGVDELAGVIEQMIQAKQMEQQEMQVADQITQPNQLVANQQGEMIYQIDAKGSVIRKNHNNHNNQLQVNNEQKFGKFSRVSQASPLSGRKTNRSNHTYGTKLQQSLPDPQDKPSISPYQCQIDSQNIDTNDQYNQLNQSQAHISSQVKQTSNEVNHLIGEHLHSQQQQTVQSINQTLRQYISHENSSSQLQVNQTKTYQENQRKMRQNKNPFSPQYVQSVMTSKQLSSLPSDSTSFVVQKHVINYANTFNNTKLIQSKQILTSKKDKQKSKSPSPSSLKQFLNTIKQHNNELPQKCQLANPHQYITSARTYSQLTKQNDSISNNLNFNQQYQFPTFIKNKQSPSNLNQNPLEIKQASLLNSSLMNVSLNKEYENFLEIQKKNPSNLYTDPKFLQAIREDVNKILKKRKLKLTSTENTTNMANFTQNNTTQTSLNPNHIYINGRKVENIKSQPSNFINPITFVTKPFNNISQFR